MKVKEVKETHQKIRKTNKVKKPQLTARQSTKENGASHSKKSPFGPTSAGKYPKENFDDADKTNEVSSLEEEDLPDIDG